VTHRVRILACAVAVCVPAVAALTSGRHALGYAVLALAAILATIGAVVTFCDRGNVVGVAPVADIPDIGAGQRGVSARRAPAIEGT
jgi:hypothetical protein